MAISLLPQPRQSKAAQARDELKQCKRKVLNPYELGS